MDSGSFFKAVKSNSLKCGPYILYGQERYARDRALDALKLGVELPEFNIALMDNPSANEIIESCEALPLMSEKRLVIVTSGGFLKAKAKDAATEDSSAQGNADQGKQLAEYVKNMCPTTILAFIEGEGVLKTKALYKAIDALGGVVEFAPYSEEQAARWAVDYAAKRGSVLSIDCARALIQMTGNDMTAVASEVVKACDYAGDEPVTEAMIKEVVHKNVEFQVFAMLEDFLAGRLEEGFTALRDAIRNGEKAPPLMAFMEGRLRNMYTARRGLDAKRKEPEIMNAIGGSPYAARKSIAAARKFTSKQLETAIIAMSDADYSIKTGMADDVSALECALTRIFALNNTN